MAEGSSGRCSPLSTDRGGVPASADDGGVDLHESVDVTGRMRLGLDLLEGSREQATEGIAAEAGVAVRQGL